MAAELDEKVTNNRVRHSVLEDEEQCLELTLRNLRSSAENKVPADSNFVIVSDSDDSD